MHCPRESGAAPGPLQDVVPDMVTLGKPIGNGFPMGAVILTRPLADGFDNGMQYFATCGACTASSAAGARLPATCLLLASPAES